MKLRFVCFLGGIALTASATVYTQTNLVSDIPGMAATTDPNLKNPWGMSFLATSPFWVSDQMTGVATLYNGLGVPQPATPLIVTIPPASPTGTVGNTAGAGAFGGAAFMFSTLAGTIDSWTGADGTTALISGRGAAGSVYTGLALLGTNLYAANFSQGRIDTFDSSFTLSSTGFMDPNLPAGYAPYNIQTIGSQLYVEYALVDPVTHRASETPNTGVVDVYNSNGTLAQRLITNGPLASPWGVVIAPANFGQFSNDLLVGNFGNGRINAFDPMTGMFLGTLSGSNGQPLENDGLWALAVRPTGPGVNPNAVYFNAGINNEADGLFGSIQVAPEPASLALGGLGLLLLIRRRRRA